MTQPAASEGHLLDLYTRYYVPVQYVARDARTIAMVQRGVSD